jgi:hypothetical protein
MKLIFCKNCGSVISLSPNIEKHCDCGLTSGRYTDNLNAVYSGDYALPIGFNNFSLTCAINRQPKDGLGERFEAFIIPVNCDTFKRVC